MASRFKATAIGQLVAPQDAAGRAHGAHAHGPVVFGHGRHHALKAAAPHGAHVDVNAQRTRRQRAGGVQPASQLGGRVTVQRQLRPRLAIAHLLQVAIDHGRYAVARKPEHRLERMTLSKHDLRAARHF
eukprot:scaffold4022_cov58-Phaeocystis_antarctica.AAC.2